MRVTLTSVSVSEPFDDMSTTRRVAIWMAAVSVRSGVTVMGEACDVGWLL